MARDIVPLSLYVLGFFLITWARVSLLECPVTSLSKGNQADQRMRAASRRRGIEITSISRRIKPSDFVDFDLIVAMDNQNKEDILAALERWSFRETLLADAHKKVRLMCSYCKKHDETEVPDPYYGGPQGFEKVLDLLEDACESLMEHILAENGRISDL